METNINNNPDRLECVNHAWKITRLGAWIQNYGDDHRGHPGIVDLLALPIEKLINTIGAKEHSTSEPPTDWDTLLDQADVKVVCQCDDSYPKQLLDLPSAPKALFYRGNLGLLSDPRGTDSMVSMIGARRATGYGLEVAAGISRELSNAGLTVVSGMALGIEGAAHRGALETGSTIAVLPCGTDRPYPATHTRLYRQIIERGLVISEQPPGADAWRWTFPARNRIIAALSGSTIAVEAAIRSGVIETAHVAKAMNRNVYAIPGPVTSASAAGTNQLIKGGTARIATGAQDVLATSN